MSNRLHQLAKPALVFDGSARLMMVPFVTQAMSLKYQGLRELFPNITNFQQMFVLLEMYAIGVEVLNASNGFAQVLGFWWDDQKLPVEKRFENFETIASFQMFDEILRAFDETRQEVPKANPILTEGPPADGDPLEHKSGGT